MFLLGLALLESTLLLVSTRINFVTPEKGSHEWFCYRRHPFLFNKPEQPRWVEYKLCRQKLPSGI
jgi:hypothetical protein